jgi:hypothetical protein
MLVLSTERPFLRDSRFLDAEPPLYAFGNAEVMHFGDYERERLKFPAALFSKFSSNAGIKIYIYHSGHNSYRLDECIQLIKRWIERL